MKIFHSLFNLALVITTLAVASVGQASDHKLANDIEPTSLSRLSRDLQGLILSNLSIEEQGSVATVSKLWQGCYEEHLMAPLRLERRSMLHDTSSLTSDWSQAALQKGIDLIFEQDGFVFVPFGHHSFPQNGVVLCDGDVTPHFPTLYAKAFGEEKEALSPQDTLCLKAVMPWSRMAFTPSIANDAKTKALKCLQTLNPNMRLIRFSPDLSFETLQENPHMLTLTDVELAEHQEILENLFKAHPNQQVHLVVESTENVFKLSATSLPKVYHLTLSDPNHAVTCLGPNFLANNTDLLSLDFKCFGAASTLNGAFVINCPSLVSFDPRGFECVTSLGHGILGNTDGLNDLSKRKFAAFYKNVETWKIKYLAQRGSIPADFTVDGYVALNPDIIMVLGMQAHPRLFAIEHFANSGCLEGRPYKQ